MADTSPYRGAFKRGGTVPVPVHYDWHWNWLFGNGDLGNQGVHEMDVARWGLGVDAPKGVITYGGRFGYEDAGLTPNTEVAVLDFGPKTLVFEMHGLTKVKFKPLKGVTIGIVFEGTEGYVAMINYTNGKAFDKAGNVIQSFGSPPRDTSEGAADRENAGQDYRHYENFIKAVRSRKIEDLNCDILEGVRSADCCHLANLSYRLGKTVPLPEVIHRLNSVKMNDSALDILDRTVQHLEENGVDLDDKTQFQCGQYLPFDPVAQNFPGNAAANELLTREYREGFVVPAGKDI
jgi:predicted dehydrogenase